MTNSSGIDCREDGAGKTILGIDSTVRDCQVHDIHFSPLVPWSGVAIPPGRQLPGQNVKGDGDVFGMAISSPDVGTPTPPAVRRAIDLPLGTIQTMPNCPQSGRTARCRFEKIFPVRICPTCEPGPPSDRTLHGRGKTCRSFRRGAGFPGNTRKRRARGGAAAEYRHAPSAAPISDSMCGSREIPYFIHRQRSGEPSTHMDAEKPAERRGVTDGGAPVGTRRRRARPRMPGPCERRTAPPPRGVHHVDSAGPVGLSDDAQSMWARNTAAGHVRHGRRKQIICQALPTWRADEPSFAGPGRNLA